MNQELFVIGAGFLLILFFSLLLIWYLNKQNAPVRTTIVQLASSVNFLLITFLLAYSGKIDGQTVATLLGAYVGYVFGKISAKGEWGD